MANETAAERLHNRSNPSQTASNQATQYGGNFIQQGQPSQPAQASGYSGNFTPQQQASQNTQTQSPSPSQPVSLSQDSAKQVVPENQTPLAQNIQSAPIDPNMRVATMTDGNLRRMLKTNDVIAPSSGASEEAPRKNYTSHIRDAEQLLDTLPTAIEHDEKANKYYVNNPQQRARELDMRLGVALAQDLAERKAKGYYLEADPSKLLNGSLINHVKGQLIDDGSPLGAYMRDMQTQLKPYLDKHFQQYRAYRAFANDAAHTNGTRWEMDKGEVESSFAQAVKPGNIARDVFHGASEMFAGLGEKLDSWIGGDNRAKAKAMGFANQEELSSAKWAERTNELRSAAHALLSQTNPATSQGDIAKDFNSHANTLFKVYTHGIDDLNNGLTDSEAAQHLQALGVDVQRSFAADAVGELSKTAGSLVTLNPFMRGAGALTKGAATFSESVAKTAIERTFRKLAANAIVGSEESVVPKLIEAWNGSAGAQMQEIATKAMTNPSAQRWMNFAKILNPDVIPVRALQDGIAFATYAWASNASEEDVIKSAANGAVFGMAVSTLGKLFSTVGEKLGGQKLLIGRAKGLLGESLMPEIEKQHKIASALANLFAPPISGIVSQAWESGDITTLFNWDDKKTRRFMLDWVSGVAFAGHDFLSMYDFLHQTRSNGKLFDAYRELQSRLDDMAKNGTSMTDIVDVHKDFYNEVDKIQHEDATTHKPRQVAVKEPESTAFEDEVSRQIRQELEAQQPPQPESEQLKKTGDVENDGHLEEAFPKPEFIAGEAPRMVRPTLRNEMEARYEATTGKKYEGKMTLPELIDIAITPLHGNEQPAEHTMKSIADFLKIAPDTKVELTGALHDENGVEQVARYDHDDRTIRINGDFDASGHLNLIGHSLSEEFAHAVSVDALKRPEVAQRVNADREMLLKKLRAGELDKYEVTDFYNNKISVASPRGRDAMEYYLGSNEEYYAGMYNANLPLSDIVNNVRLPGDTRYPIFNRSKQYLPKNTAEIIQQSVNAKKEGVTQFGAFNLDAMPKRISVESLEDQAAEQVQKHIEDKADKWNGERSNEFMLKQIYGTNKSAHVVKRWAKIYTKEGAEGLLNSVRRQTDAWLDKANISSENRRTEIREAMHNRASMFLLNKANNVAQTVWAMDANSNIAIVEPNKPTSMRGITGTDFRFGSRQRYSAQNAITSRLNDMAKNGRNNKYAREYMTSIAAARPAECQAYIDNKGNQQNSYPKNSDHPYEDALTVLQSSYNNGKGRAVFMLPRVASGAMAFDITPFMKKFHNEYVGDIAAMNAAGDRPIASALNDVHNMITYDWLSSHDGGKQGKKFDAISPIVDVGKVLKLGSSRQHIESLTGDELLNATLRDDILAVEKTKADAVEHLKKAGFNAKLVADLREAVSPIWDSPYGDSIPFGRDASQGSIMKDGQHHGGIADIFEMARLMHNYIMDPSLKSLARTRKVGAAEHQTDDGRTTVAGDVINSGKFVTKYAGVSVQNDGYSMLKDMNVTRAITQSRKPELWNEDGTHNEEVWKDHGYHTRQTPNGPMLYEKVLCFDPTKIPDSPIMERFKIAFADAMVDGATVIINPKSAEVMNAIVGKEDASTFKNSHVYHDEDHSIITKTAYHKTATRSNDPNDGELNHFFEALHQQGISRIKFASSVKSGGTFRLKSAKAGLPGMEDKLVSYDNKGFAKLDEGDGGSEFMDMAMTHILNGGTVPDWMIHNEDLFGPQGQQFISSSDGTKNTTRAFSQKDLAHYQPGSDYYEKYHPHFQKIDAINKSRRERLERAVVALTSNSLSSSDARDVGALMQAVHDHVWRNQSSDDPAAHQFMGDDILLNIARSYTLDEQGRPVANARAQALAATMSQGLLNDVGSKPSIIKQILHDAVESNAKSKYFGKEAKLVPHFFPADAITQGLTHEMLKNRMLTNDEAVLAQRNKDATEYAYSLLEQHIDPVTNTWKKGSNGIIIGEYTLRDLNEAGMRKYGMAFKMQGMGSKILGDLKPTDAASSNPPMQIIGIIPESHGMAMSAEMMEILGRDQDGDGFGIFPETPDWRGEFLPLWEKMYANNVHTDQSDRVIYAKAEHPIYGNSINQKQLTKLLSTYVGDRNQAAYILGARNDTTGMHPLTREHYQKQAEADTSQGKIVAQIASYAAMMRSPEHRAEIEESYILNDDPHDVQARMSFIKQYGAVDLNAASPVNWNDAMFNTMVKGVKLQSGVISLAELRQNHPARYENEYMHFTKLCNDAYTGSARAIERQTIEKASVASSIDVAPYLKKVHSGDIEPKHEKFLSAQIEKPYYGFTLQEWKDNPSLIEAQGRALLDGYEKNINEGRFAPLFKDKGLYVRVEGKNGRPTIIVENTKNMRTESYTMDEIFNSDGSFSDAWKTSKEANNIPDSIFFGDGSVVGAFGASTKTGKEKFIEYNDFNNAVGAVNHARFVGSLIADIAKQHEDPSDYASRLLSRYAAPNTWLHALDAVKSAGINPTTQDHETQRFLDLRGFDPKTGEWLPIEKVNGKMTLVPKEINEPVGKEVASETTSKDLVVNGKTYEDALVSTVNHYQMKKSFETAFIDRVESAINSKATKGESYGAFNFNWGKERKTDVASIVDDYFTKTNGFNPTTPEHWQKAFDGMKEELAKKYKNVPVDMLNSMLDVICPAHVSASAEAHKYGVETDKEAEQMYQTIHVYDTLKAIENANKNLTDKKGRFIPQSLSNFWEDVNPWHDRSSTAIVLGNSKDLVPTAHDEAMFIPKSFMNGTLTRHNDPVTWGQMVGKDLNSFKGAKALPRVYKDYLVHLEHFNKLKAVQEVLAGNYADKKYVMPGEDVQWMTNSKLFDEEYLPNVQVTASLNGTTFQHEAQATVNGNMVEDGLREHYQKLHEAGVLKNASDIDRAVEVMKTAIDAQIEGKKYANTLAAMRSIHEDMFGGVYNSLLAHPDLPRMQERHAQMIEKYENDIAHYTSLSPRDAINNILHTPDVLAGNAMLSMVAEGDTTYKEHYKDTPGGTIPGEWQNRMSYEVGQKLFPEIFVEDYDSQAQHDPDKNVMHKSPLLMERLKFMTKFINAKHSQAFEDYQDGSLLFSKQKLNDKEIMMQDNVEDAALRDLARRTTTAQVIDAMNNVIGQYEPDPSLHYLPHVDVNHSRFADRIKSGTQSYLRDISNDARTFYMTNPDPDSRAHQFATAIMSEVYGQKMNFTENIPAKDFIDKIKANMIQNGGAPVVGDLPGTKVGRQLIVSFSKADGTQHVVNGAYVGAYVPRIIDHSIETDPKGRQKAVSKDIGYDDKPYMALYNAKNGNTYVVPVDNIGTVVAHDSQDWGGRLQNKIDQFASVPEEVLNILAGQTKLHQTTLNGKTSYNTTTLNRSAEDLIDSVRHYDGYLDKIRDVPFKIKVEQAIYKQLRGAMGQFLYLPTGSVVSSLTGLGMMAYGAMSHDGSLFAGGAGSFALGIGAALQKSVRAYASNRTSGSRMAAVFDASNPIEAMYKHYQKIIENNIGSDGDVKNPTAAEAATILRHEESQQGAILDRDLGNANTPERIRAENWRNLIYMNRMHQKFQDLADNQYVSYRQEMQDKMAQLNKSNADYAEQKLALQRQYSWRNFLETEHPDLLKGLAARKLVAKPDKNNTIQWQNDAYLSAKEQYEKLSLASQGLFDLMSGMGAASGNAALKALGAAPLAMLQIADRSVGAGIRALSRLMTGSEASTARHAYVNARETMANLDESRIERGLPKLDPMIASNTIDQMSKISTGDYSPNYAVVNDLIRSMSSIFTAYNANKNTYMYSNLKTEQERYDFVKKALETNGMLKKFASDVGIDMADFTLLDPKKKVARAVVAGATTKVLGSLAVGLAINGITSAFFKEDDESGQKFARNMLMGAEQRDMNMGGIQRGVSEDDIVIDNMWSLGNIAVALSPMYIKASMHDASGRRSGIETAERPIKDAKLEINKLNFGVGPLLSMGHRLVTDGIMLGALHMDMFKNYYTRNSDGNEDNAKKAIDIQKQLTKLDMVNHALSPVPQAQVVEKSIVNSLDVKGAIKEEIAPSKRRRK